MSSRRCRERKIQFPDAVEKPKASETDFPHELAKGDPRTSNTDSYTDHSDVSDKAPSQDQTGVYGVERVSDSRSTRMEDRPWILADSEPPQVCVVCGDKASGQYFGAVVCLPCKSFYIRCTKDGEPFFSTRCLGNCDVTKQARIRCQSCRYQKCLNAGMSRREKPERVEPSEGQYLCLVCGDLANGIHFGVFTCEGCKKFFRRGLVENKSYNCKGDNSCVINPRSRNTCRACRYRTCIEVGMSREAIKMGRPKKRDPDPCWLVKRSTSRRSTDETTDTVVINSNESDSDEEVKLLEIPVGISVKAENAPAGTKVLTGTEDSQKELSGYNSPQPPCVKDTAPLQGVSSKSWRVYPLQQMARSPKETETETVQPLSSSDGLPSLSPSFTVTSKSEYGNFDDSRTGSGESPRGKPSTGQSFNPGVASLNDIPISIKSPVASVEPSTAESDIEAIYSMSSEEIDSMLRLLEDYERPKIPIGSRRRAVSSGIEDLIPWKRKRFNYSNESMGNGVSSYSRYEEEGTPRLSADQSSQSQNVATTWNQARNNQKQPPLIVDSSESKTCERSASQSQFPKPTSESTQLETSKAKSIDLPSPTDGFVSYSGLPAFQSNTSSRQSSKSASEMQNRQCSCRCWAEKPNTVPYESNEKWKTSQAVSSNDTPSKRNNSTGTNAKAPNMKDTESPSLGEISKAFEVLYDKLGYSQDDICNVERMKQMRASMESWWGLDTDCPCIQVSGGLCLCDGSSGQAADETFEEKYRASVTPPVARIRTSFVGEPFSPYLAKKYISQIPDLLDPASISDVQQQVLHQLLETCLVSITDTTENAGKEESCTTTEIAALLRA